MRQVRFSEWAGCWEKPSVAYERHYLPQVRQMADPGMLPPRNFCVGIFGASQRLTDMGLTPAGDLSRLVHLIERRGWVPVMGSGPRGMWGTRHPDLQLDVMGALCSTYIALDVGDLGTFLQVAYVLQFAQQILVAKSIGRHAEYEYLLHPACTRFGYHPRIICVGKAWEPLARLVEKFAQAGCIRPRDRALFAWVENVDQAVEVAANDYREFSEVCGSNGLERTAPTWSAAELEIMRQRWIAVRRAFDRKFLPAFLAWARMQEPRIRVATYGSHLKGLQNGEATRFSRVICERHLDIVTGGGTAVMAEVGQALQEVKKQNGVGEPSLADDLRLLEPKVVGMMLALPDEQATPACLDIQFPNRHFWKRLLGFWTLCSVHVAKSKGGFGTMLEIAYALFMARASMQARRRGQKIRNQALMNPLCRKGFVPHVIAVGDLWKEVGETLRLMHESGAISREERALLKVVENVDEGLAQVGQEVTRIRRFAARRKMELIN